MGQSEEAVFFFCVYGNQGVEPSRLASIVLLEAKAYGKKGVGCIRLYCCSPLPFRMSKNLLIIRFTFK